MDTRQKIEFNVSTEFEITEIEKNALVDMIRNNFGADISEIMNIATNCHFMSRDFLSLYEQAKAGCGLFYFWGHTYEMLDYDKLYDQLDQKIKYISEDAEAEWVDVVELAAELEERMAD